MAKICFVLGEGGTEREFFPALLKSGFGFGEHEYLKYPYIFTRDDIWWIMFPANIAHYNGCARLHVAETYKDLTAFRDAHLHHFGPNPEIHYLVIRDGDYADEGKRQEWESEIRAVSQPILKKDPIIHVPFGEIENWFFAGLNENFPHFDQRKIEEVRRLLAVNPDEHIQSKEKLDSILVPEISEQRLRIAQEVGSNFDITKARTNSVSFEVMFTEIEKLGLI